MIQSPGCKQFIKIVADSEEKLLKLLNGTELELFQAFSDAQGKLSSVSIADGIVEGNVCVDHVHLCAKIPPKISVSEFIGYLKGKSALMIFDKRPEYKQKGSRHFWARGYYVDIVGRNEEEIKRYIKNQTDTDMREYGIKQ